MYWYLNDYDHEYMHHATLCACIQLLLIVGNITTISLFKKWLQIKWYIAYIKMAKCQLKVILIIFTLNLKIYGELKDIFIIFTLNVKVLKTS